MADGRWRQAGAALESKPTAETEEQTIVAVLLALSVSHLLNDLMQSLLPAVYPILKKSISSRLPRSA